MIKTICITAGFGLLTACATTTQLTSGSDYVARYKTPVTASMSSIDQRVRDVALIEPDLQFPARIGIARIERGKLVALPSDEAEIFQELTQELGVSFGDFVPVSPLITGMVAPRVKGPQHATSVIDQIRLGSARQHLDYVLTYEVSNVSKRKSNALRLTDLTVLGLFVLPSRNVKVHSTASAILIDVRNGYPYGTATTFAQKSTAVTVAGASARKTTLEDKMRYDAVRKLSEEISTFMTELYDHTQTKQS